MFIGDILVSLGLVTPADVAAAVELQHARGGQLGDRLVDLGRIAPEALEAVVKSIPASPRMTADAGLSASMAMNLVMKAIFAAGAETPSEVGDLLKLPPRSISDTLDDAVGRGLLMALGDIGAGITSERRYAITAAGKEWAQNAMRHCAYVGPAPVPLEAYCAQIEAQRIARERVDPRRLGQALGHMVISDALMARLGPAINSGKSMLLYGPPGNGKTSIAEQIGAMFGDVVYIPYCFEVDGQIVKVFDPGIHKSVKGAAGPNAAVPSVRREPFDVRWVACRRPVVAVGGELTLEMLDLGYHPEAKFYEAPLHIKALGGVMLIDDFGRQLVAPEALLNRWIVPLENRVDSLKLGSGKAFTLPFDELVVFSTNYAPRDLMDGAFLRRVPYKIEIAAPTVQEFHAIFRHVARDFGDAVTDAVIDGVIGEITQRNAFPLASYQPRFIVDQVRDACRFEDLPLAFEPRFVAMALANLHTADTPGFGVTAKPPGGVRLKVVGNDAP